MRTHSTRPNLRFQSEAQRLRLLVRMAEEAELIGGRIRELRENAGLTQRELAEKMEGHAEGKDISRWENGKHVPEASNLKALANALETTIADLRAGRLADRREPKSASLEALSGPASESELAEELHRTNSELAEVRGELSEVRTELERVLSRLLHDERDREVHRNG